MTKRVKWRGKWIKMERYHPNRHIHSNPTTPSNRKPLNNWPVCYDMGSKIPFSRMRAKNTALFPLLTEKKQRFLDLTKRGKPDDIAHGSITQVPTVCRCRWLVSTPGLGITPSPNNCILIFKSAMSIMFGNGTYKPRNSENVDRVGRSRIITRFYFALEMRVPENHLSSNKDYPQVGEEREPRWQLASNASAVRSSQRIKHGRREFLLWVPWKKSAVCDQDAGLLSETDC